MCLQTDHCHCCCGDGLMYTWIHDSAIFMTGLEQFRMPTVHAAPVKLYSYWLANWGQILQMYLIAIANYSLFEYNCKYKYLI